MRYLVYTFDGNKKEEYIIFKLTRFHQEWREALHEQVSPSYLLASLSRSDSSLSSPEDLWC